MSSLRALLVAPLVLLACGEYAGPEANTTYFWQLKSSLVEFGACSDAVDFRKDVTPVPISDNSFIIYKVSADAKQAVAQDCTRVDTGTCGPSDAGIVFDVAGRELVFTHSVTGPIGATGCSLSQTQTWTLTDATRAMTLEISNVLTLTDSPAACAVVEQDLKTRSPNMLGVEGCVLTSKLEGVLSSAQK